ncbi:MAG: radical SAM protein [Candidatus Omnitrophica bacterium]|nr:radical SAM protein [Candidatus Omnitrophota bacterium]
MVDTAKKIALIKKIKPALHELYNPCRLCPLECGIYRENGEKGFCRSGSRIAVYSYSPHHGEEPPLSGNSGSGTIFFTHCNMKCVYCQNYAFSQESDFGETETESLAQKMLELSKMGCHNINLVSPTHYIRHIIDALELAYENSLDIPIVYNTSGYDTVNLISLMDGIVDIYLADMRYSRDEAGKSYSGVPGYASYNRKAIKEMFGQVGELKCDKNGIAEKGVIVRLLIMPCNTAGTLDSLRFLKDNVSSDIFLSIMSQYYPTYKAKEYPELARKINRSEYKEVLEEAEKLGFTNGWIQGLQTDADRFLGTNVKKGRFWWG